MNPYEDIDWMLGPSPVSKRTKAMQWWINLTPDKKQEICDRAIGQSRKWQTLTGSEIEKIYQ